MLRADHLAHQHRGGRPFAPEAQSHQGAQDEKLSVGLSKSTQESEERKPRNGNLQGAYAADAIRQRAREPAPKAEASNVAVPISPASALVIAKAAMIAGMAKLNIWTSMASSIQPAVQAQNVFFSRELISAYHAVG
jgi:hypothetical protein